MSVTPTWTNPTSSPPDLTTGQTLTQTAWEMVLSNLDYLGGATGSGGTIGGVPSGTIVAYGAGTTDPPGWFLCDGRAVSTTVYSALLSAISTTYGNGNGSTTFNIPDLRSRIPMGADNAGTGAAGRASGSVALGNTSGEDTHVLVTGELAAHSHSHNHGFSDPNHVHSYSSGGTGSGQGLVSQTNTNLSPQNTSSNGTGISFSTDATSTGSGTAHNNRQLNQITNFIIKQ